MCEGYREGQGCICRGVGRICMKDPHSNAGADILKRAIETGFKGWKTDFN